MKEFELIKYIEKKINEQKFTADEIYNVAGSLLNCIVLEYLDMEEITKEDTKGFEAFLDELVGRIREQLVITSHLYVTKDSAMLNMLKEKAKNLNLSIADEIDERFKEIKEKLKFEEK